MEIEEIVTYWKRQIETDNGQWLHPEDLDILSNRQEEHTFKLDFPVGLYIGDVIGVPVIVLGLNAGYHPTETKADFDRGEVDIQGQLEQNCKPDKVDWNDKKGFCEKRLLSKNQLWRSSFRWSSCDGRCLCLS